MVTHLQISLNMKYIFEPKTNMSAYQQRKLLEFLIQFLSKKFTFEFDDTVEQLPNEIKQHFKNKV